MTRPFLIRVAALGSLLAVAACATPGERMTGSAPPAGKGAAILLGHISQSDAVERGGAVILRKLEPGSNRFLPEGPDTLVKVNLLPAFRFADIRPPNLGGFTRLNPNDLTPVVVSPGRWAIERTYTSGTTGNLTLSSDSLADLDDGALSTWVFDVGPDELVTLPPLTVSAQDRWGSTGPAFISPSGSASDLTALAAQRGLNPTEKTWTPVTIDCQPIRYEGFQLRGEARCAPR